MSSTEVQEKAAGALLETKLMPNFVVPDLLRRERLLNRLDDGPQPRLVLVQGEAGSGKSSLLFDYTRVVKRPVAWYSLGPEDADPATFLRYLLRALDRKFPGVAPALAELAGLVPATEQTVPLLGTALVNDLTAYPERVALVLDDYHLVQKSPAVAALVAFLVTAGPPNLTLFLSSREKPGLPLARLRAKRLLVHLGPDDLRFDEGEIRRLFAEVWKQPLEPDLVRILSERTEGWVTALQLVAQQVRDREPAEVRRRVEGLHGQDPDIYEYLVTEVLDEQPEEVRRFLAVTSLFETFSADLAEAVCDGVHVEQVLHHLQEIRLFLVQVQDCPGTFRYHHLFQEFLQRQLKLTVPRAEVEALHLRAARWLEDHGDLLAALPHYLSAGDPDRAAVLLESVGSDLIAQGMQRRLGEWLEGLPLEVRSRHRWLRVLEAELIDLEGDWTRAVQEYEAAARHYRGLGDRARLAQVLEKLALCCIKYSESEKLLQACEEGLQLCRDEDVALKAMLSAWTGATLLYTGKDWERGCEMARQGHRLALQSDDPRALAWGWLCYGYGYHFLRGNFGESVNALNEGIDYFRHRGWALSRYQLAMNRALVQILQGELGPARELIEDYLVMARRAHHVFVAKGFENLQAMVALEMRDLDRAAEGMARIAEGAVPAQFKPWYYRNRMLLHCLQGNLEQARVAAEEMLRFLTLNGFGLYAPECLAARGFFLSRLGDLDEAWRSLEHGLKLSREAGARFWEMKAHALMAWLAREHARPSDAAPTRRPAGGAGRPLRASGALRRHWKEHLEAALDLTEAHGYTAWWQADPLRVASTLLAEARAHDVRPEVAERLGARLGGPGVEELLPLLADASVKVRCEAVRLLGRVTDQPDKAVEALRQTWKSDASAQVRNAARQSLRGMPSACPRVTVHALGRFEVRRDGALLPPDAMAPRTLAVLKYLLNHAHQVLTPEAMMERFWPNLDGARHNLSEHLRRLRRVFNPDDVLGGDAFLVRVGGGYQVRFERDRDFDVLEFERLVGEGRRAEEAGDGETATARYLRAENLYRGDYMPDDPYDDELEARRRDLAASHRHAVMYLVDRDLQEKAHESALARCRALLARDPVDEAVVQKQLYAYGALGDAAELVRAFRRFREALQEIGPDLRPAPATLTIFRHYGGVEEPGAAPGRAPGRAASGPSPGPPAPPGPPGRAG